MEIKSFLKTKKGIACIAAAVVLLLAAVIFGGYEIWHYHQAKFHNLTIELGTDSVSISDFMTQYARPKKVGFVSDVSQVDLNRVGEYPLTLRHGSQEETITLTIQDTTAPTAEFAAEVTVPSTHIPTASDFVSNVQDLSAYLVYFENQPVMPEDYSDVTVHVIVEDAYCNRTEQDCTLSYLWMNESCAVELGQTLTKDMVLLDPSKDDALLDQAQLDAVNEGGVGEYTLTSATAAKSLTCSVTVQDTTPPELELKEVQRYLGRSADLKDFVVSATDISGDVELRLMTELSFDTEGSFQVVVEAEDMYGNIATGETTLYITTDTVPPTIRGLTALTVEKNSSPNFLSGVSATDQVDGACKVTYDMGSLNLSKAGTYYVTYKAADKSGNVASAKRKIIVQHDAEDTAALVKSIADKLSNDPESIRNYVRSNIGYSHDWGGDDPVWNGFTNRSGNCYVHALCLKAIFDQKGIESRLIWVTEKTHYWLIVKINGSWKHIDATPGRTHSKYSLMNDEQRLETLSGRVWDTTQWPACN